MEVDASMEKEEGKSGWERKRDEAEDVEFNSRSELGSRIYVIASVLIQKSLKPAQQKRVWRLGPFSMKKEVDCADNSDTCRLLYASHEHAGNKT